jgi:hypothetical protein
MSKPNHGELSYRGRRGHGSPLFQLSDAYHTVGHSGSYRVVGRMVTGDFESQSLTIGRFRRSLPYPTVRLHFDCQVRSTCSILTELSSRYLTTVRVDEVFNAHQCWIRQSGLLQNLGHQVSVRFRDWRWLYQRHVPDIHGIGTD